MYPELLFTAVIAVQFVVADSYFIEILEPRNSTNETRSLLKMVVDKKNTELRASGSSFSLRLSNISSGRNDIYQNGYSLLKSNVIGMFSLDPDPMEGCFLSSISGIPLFHLHDQENNKVEHFNSCDKFITMSADFFSYAKATDQILGEFKWTKIALVFEGHRFYQTVYFQSLNVDNNYQITYIQVENENNMTTFAMAKKVIQALAASDVDVILLYVRDSYKSMLLSMEACNPKKSYVWIIQKTNSYFMKSHPNHMTVGFHLPRERSSFLSKNTTIQDSINLIFDTTSVVSIAMDKLLSSGSWLPGNSTSALLSNRRKLYEQAIKTTITGKTGMVKFNKKGERLVEELSVVNLRNDVFVKIVTWLKSSASLQLSGEITKNIEYKNSVATLQGRKLSVTTMAIEPFVFKTILPNGGIKYTGFCIDLLQKLASDLKFTYDIHEPPDLQYGAVRNGSWNGMIREIIDGEADMIVADTTITGERETAVDFTVGYMYYREDMVMRKTPIEHIDFLQFMSPFAGEVWFILLLGFLVVSLALFVVNYFSPYGHKNDEGSKTSEEFQFFNCFWFSIACMLQQGADHLPKSFSARVLVGFFWFSILVWVSTYTANLAAFFTVKNVVHPITSFQQAVYSSEYQMGISRKSHLYTFFSKSQVELYQRAWKLMKEIPKDNEVGIQWARERQYIHIANGPLLEYEIGKPPCDLIKIQGLETPKSYGFALKTDDPHLQQISLGILHLRDTGFIDTLRRKYWTNNKCNTDDKKTITRSTIQLSSMAGVFVVLAVGCLASFIALAIEIYWFHNGARIQEELRNKNISLGSTRKLFVKSNNDLQMGRVSQAAEVKEKPTKLYGNAVTSSLESLPR